MDFLELLLAWPLMLAVSRPLACAISKKRRQHSHASIRPCDVRICSPAGLLSCHDHVIDKPEQEVPCICRLYGLLNILISTEASPHSTGVVRCGDRGRVAVVHDTDTKEGRLAKATPPPYAHFRDGEATIGYKPHPRGAVGEGSLYLRLIFSNLGFANGRQRA